MLMPTSLVNLAKRVQSLGEGLHLIVVIADVVGPKFVIPLLSGKKLEDLRPPKAEKNHEVTVK